MHTRRFIDVIQRDGTRPVEEAQAPTRKPAQCTLQSAVLVFTLSPGASRPVIEYTTELTEWLQ